MTLDFYYMSGSPPCAVVSLVFATVGIESRVKSHSVDLMGKEQLSPQYLKLNPQHTCPTIVDDGFVLWESRAIAKYLVGKYGGDLYPEDLKTRAIIDQRLDFDCGTLYARLAEYYYAPFLFGEPMDEKKLASLHEALVVLNSFLEGTKYAAGSALTLADYCLAVTVSVIETADISVQDYPKIVRWHALVKSTIPKYEEIIGKYMQDFKDYIDNLTKE
ncbi:unnamed protein product, partial [Iphiclides podalirius]